MSFLMKTLIFLMLTTTSAWAKPLVLVSYYDPFGNAPINNSEVVAKELSQRFAGSDINLKLCPLNTVFDKSYAQLEDCIKGLEATPDLVIGLGEAGCNVKIEIAARNFDRTMGPDNAGNERKGEIIPNAPAHQSMRYPLPQMYCAVDAKNRSSIVVSNNAGSFVCNNTAYQMTHYHPELQFGFIHVPSYNCRGAQKKTQNAVNVLQAMISKGAEFLSIQFISSLNTPHSSNELRMAITKNEINELRATYKKGDKCMYEFFKRTQGVDERGFLSFLD